ncbi:hypothetical protein AAHA92_17346 [Salvia divinorum]|uniref:Uncharacterized protein n=1 Tax=Salvia divinorum TaxID=28513 RepID=A0ABD1GYH5_SALDI
MRQAIHSPISHSQTATLQVDKSNKFSSKANREQTTEILNFSPNFNSRNSFRGISSSIPTNFIKIKLKKRTNPRKKPTAAGTAVACAPLSNESGNTLHMQTAMSRSRNGAGGGGATPRGKKKRELRFHFASN